MVPKTSKFPTIGQLKINTLLLNGKNSFLSLVIWSNYSCRKIVRLFKSRFPELFSENGKFCLLQVSSEQFLKILDSENELREKSILEIATILDSNVPIENQLENFEFSDDSFFKGENIILIVNKNILAQKNFVNISSKPSSVSNSKEIITEVDEIINDSIKTQYPWDIVHPDDNLVKLTHLSQDYVMKKLYARFRMGCFYSYIDNILIFINPYCILPIYNPKYCNIYRARATVNLPPHIYGLTADLYYTMMEQNIDQCILISGESGSGKTETAKQMIRQITFLNEYGNSNSLISAIMVSSTVLEAFGNAKNVQNINSSRFGNLTEIFFSQEGLIMCGRLKIYMLEKSRIVLNNENESNFHIFYYMLAGIYQNSPIPYDFEYLKSNDYRGDNSENQNELKKLKNCLTELNFCQETQEQLFSILLAILHIGNIEIENSDDKNTDNIHLKKAAELLHININSFNQILTTLSFELLGEKIKLDFSATQIKVVKDSIAKIIYSFLFEWIVYRINHELKAYLLSGKIKKKNSIKILDIFGFENSKSNSFEEFCINYVNECLQNFLNQKTLKIQQDEYVEEGLEWRRVSYLDNTPVVELYVHKPYGLFNLLEDECKLREGSDLKLLDKFNYFHKNNENISTVGLRPGRFMVKHYAGPIVYDIKGFREKNINEINKNIIKLLKESQCSLLRAILIRHTAKEHWNILRYALWFIFGIQKKPANLLINKKREDYRYSTDNLASPSLKNVIIEKRICAFSSQSHQSLIMKHSKMNRKKKQMSEEDFQQNHLYISSYFQKSLNELSEIFSDCKCYFIKCIKSNNNSLPLCFDFNTVLTQLKYTGIIQTISIRQAGYSYRYKKSEFYEKYRVIFKTHLSDDELKIFFTFNNISDEFYRIGKTMIFFKDESVQFLGNLKVKKTQNLIILLQNKIRNFLRCGAKFDPEFSESKILEDYLKTAAKMIAFRKYKIVERDKFVIAEARKILINNPQIALQDKTNLNIKSDRDVRGRTKTEYRYQTKKFIKRGRTKRQARGTLPRLEKMLKKCFSTYEPVGKGSFKEKKFSANEVIQSKSPNDSNHRSTSTDTHINESVFNAQSEIELEDPESKTTPLVLFTKKFWISKIKPTKNQNFTSNLFTSIIKENKNETRISDSSLNSKPNINTNAWKSDSSILLKTEHDLFCFYTFLNQKITELNNVRSNVRDSFLKNNHADNYFAGCLSSFIATLFLKFKQCIQKNEFNPISTKEIYNLFEDSVAKYSKVDRDENAAQIVFKNALYGIICDFTKKKKSIFKKRSFDKLIKQIKESEFKIEGHLFETYKIYANSTCEICNKTIWENALICNECKMLIHKDCRTEIRQKCRLKSVQTEEKKFFDVELINITSFNTPIPPKLWELLEQIENRGLMVEGIYRITGNLKKTKETMFLLDNVENKDLAFLQDIHPHVLAGLVKHFLRHLPNSLIPQEVSFDVSNSAVLKKSDMSRRFWKIVGALPTVNRIILDHLSKHLAKVASHKDENKMSSNSLAIVLSPCLFKHEDIDYEIYRSNLNSRIKFVEFLIEIKSFYLNSQDLMIGVGDIPEDYINSCFTQSESGS